MQIKLKIGDRDYTAATDNAVSLAKRLDFETSHADFAAPPPERQPLRMGDFVGATRDGGGCNVDQLSLIPHCHGTHTETIGHIVDEPIPIADTNLPAWMICALLTVATETGGQSEEAYQPARMDHDQLITAAQLSSAFASLAAAARFRFAAAPVKALAVRCQPPAAPRDVPPPYFSSEGIRWCIELQVEHLLVESPSIDRVNDGGQLINHHAYWNVPTGVHALSAEAWTQKTITESISVPVKVADGVYLLNLQVPRFVSDAAPSQPVIWTLKLVGDASGVPR